MIDKLITTDTEGADVLPPIADNTLIQIAESAEKRVDAMNKIKHMALRLTNANDWVDEKDRPYLQASGSEKVARLFGISWRIYEPQRDELDEGHFMYSYRGEFSLGGASIEAIGTRSSKDGFFTKYDKETRTKLPASEIDPGDVKKAAYTNLLGNGITRLLGIRNLTWADLDKYAEIKKEQVRTVKYRESTGGQAAKQTGGKPGPATETKAPAGNKPQAGGQEGNGKPQIREPGAPATEAQVMAIHNILKNQLGIGDELTKAQKVQAILGLASAPTALTKLTKGQASQVIEKLNAEIGAKK